MRHECTFSGSVYLYSALQVSAVPTNSSWAGVFAVLPEKDCRKEGENHVSGKRLPSAERLAERFYDRTSMSQLHDTRSSKCSS